MVSEVQYGGKITDNLDRRLFINYGSTWVAPRVLADGFSYNPTELLARIPNDFNYTLYDGLEVDGYRKWAASFPEIDSPEVFGLHPNADLTYRVKEVSTLLRTFGETQPRQSGGGSGRSVEVVVTEKADELLSKLPEEYVEEEYRCVGACTLDLWALCACVCEVVQWVSFGGWGGWARACRR
jgi:dynein heavy chain